MTMDKHSNMVLVPREPTPEMVEAHYRAHAEADTVLADAQAVWAAMLYAAPQPSLEGEVGEMVERLKTYRPFEGEWGDKTHHTICDEAAALLQSLSAEAEAANTRRDWLQVRLDAAESRLSEAVEVLKPFAAVVRQMPEGVKLINGKLDEFSPITVTVTKGQAMAAIRFLSQGGGNG